MNIAYISGEMASEPKVSVINEPELKTVVCKCMIGACRDESGNGEAADYIQAVAFGSRAKEIVKEFPPGTGISVHGCLVNCMFKEAGGTRHFTNILLVQRVADRNCGTPYVYPQEEKHDRELYKRLCRAGYLPVDEDDYYDLARRNTGTGEMNPCWL